MSAEPLAERIARYLARPEGDRFDELAAAACSELWERDAAFRELWGGAGASPERPDGWRAMPAVPAPEPRGGEPAATLERDAAERAFRSSCLAGLQAPPILQLVAGGEAPSNDLARDCARLVERFGGPGSGVAVKRGHVDAVAARSWLAARQRDRRPAVLLATAASLARLLATLERQDLRFQLAHGSRVVVMDPLDAAPGFDARRAAAAGSERLGLVRDGLLGRLDWSGVPTPLYGRPAAGGGLEAALPSPWTRIRALEPDTGRELPEGSAGRLSVVDLAIRGRPFHLWTPSAGVLERDGKVRVLPDPIRSRAASAARSPGGASRCR